MSAERRTIRPTVIARLFLFGLLFLISCNRGEHPSINHSEQIEQSPEVAALEKKLSDAAIQYLAISKDDDPQGYEKRRQDFESALAAYLQAAENTKNITLRLTRDGRTFLLPLQLIDAGRLTTEKNRSSRISTTDELISQQFIGEILDLLWLPKSKDAPSQLICLFSDSLIGIHWPENDKAAPVVFRFDQSNLRNFRGVYPSGVLSVYNNKPPLSSQIIAITSNLKSAVVLEQQQKKFIQTDSVAFSENTALPFLWRTEDDQESFRHWLPRLPSFRSLRTMPDSGLYVMLDKNGYLNLYAELKGQPLWRSNRSWGNRLFVLQPDRIAVCNSHEKNFVAFNLTKRSFEIFGQSPTFNGRVSALLPVSMKEKDGLLVSLVSTNENGQVISRLHFFPRETIAWNPQIDFMEPQFPDYNARVTFLRSAARESIRQDWHRPYPPMIWFNVFENLFTTSEDGELVNLLASKVLPDSARRVWEIYLRKNVRFADGTLLTANNIITSWEQTWRTCKENHCSSQWLWRNILGANDFVEGNSPGIAGLQVIDDYTLKVILNESRPNFAEHLAQACFSIAKQESKNKPLIGTGPFRLAAQKSNHKASIIFERNLFYHGSQALLQELEIASYRTDVVEALPSYRAAIASVRQKSDVEYFQQIGTNEVRPSPAQTIYFLAINPSAGGLPDIAQRRCVAFALDREILAAIIDKAECTMKKDFFSELAESESATPACRSPQFSRALNIAFLARDEVARAIAERLAVRLTHLKIPHRSPKAMALASFEQLRRNGKYDILIDSYTLLFVSPLCNLSQLINRGYVVDSTTVNALESALASSTTEYPAAMEQRLIAEAVLFPVMSAQDYVITPADMAGTRLRSNYIDLGKARLPRQRQLLEHSAK